MTARIERQIERFAPGFQDLILARHSMGPEALEAHNPNLVGGRSDRWCIDHSSDYRSADLAPLQNAGALVISLLGSDAAGRRRPRHVRTLIHMRFPY